MEQFWCIVNQVFQFGVMLITGYIAAALKITDKVFLNGLARMIMRVLIPVLVFVNTVTSDRNYITQCYPIIFLSAGMYLALIVVFKIIAQLIGVKEKYNHVYRASMIFGNVGFIGIPLILALYPKNGAVYIALMTIVDQIFLWTYGLKMTERESEKKKFSFKNFLNPALCAVILSLAILLLGFKLPNSIVSPLNAIGRTSTPLALIYLGGLLYCSEWKFILSLKELYIGILVKMILFPIGYYFIVRLFYSDLDMIRTMALVSAMPSMVVIAMFAQTNNNEGEYVLGTVLATTVVSILTLTVVSFFIF